MNNTKLKKAMILGTIALIWTIPSVNLFGVIAVIVSWIAYKQFQKEYGLRFNGNVYRRYCYKYSFCNRSFVCRRNVQFRGRGCGRFHTTQ